MHFCGYIVRQGIFMGNCSDIREVMLYNGRLIFIRGADGGFKPGELVNFYCEPGVSGIGEVDLEVEQAPGTFYRIGWGSSYRITEEHIISTFMIGASLLGTARLKKADMPPRTDRFFTRYIKAWLTRAA